MTFDVVSLSFDVFNILLLTQKNWCVMFLVNCHIFACLNSLNSDIFHWSIVLLRKVLQVGINAWYLHSKDVVGMCVAK